MFVAIASAQYIGYGGYSGYSRPYGAAYPVASYGGAYPVASYGYPAYNRGAYGIIG